MKSDVVPSRLPLPALYPLAPLCIPAKISSDSKSKKTPAPENPMSSEFLSAVLIFSLGAILYLNVHISLSTSSYLRLI